MIKLEKPDQNRNHATLIPTGPRKSLHEIDLGLAESVFKTYGAILFRGFTYDFDGFREFSTRFCTSTVVNNSGGRRTIDRDSNIQTVNLGNDEFPLHPELSRRPWKPDVCWFACVRPPEQGGETTICDGVQVVRKLRPELFNILKDRRLVYTEPASSKDCLTWLNSQNPTNEMLANPPRATPFEFFRKDGQVYCSFSRSVFHQPMFCNDLAFGNFLIFSRLYNKMRHFPVFENGDEVPDAFIYEINNLCQEITVSHKWDRNDILMLDNSRFMHGRNGFGSVKDRLILTLFGYLTFAEPDAEEIPDAPWRQQGFWH